MMQPADAYERYAAELIRFATVLVGSSSAEDVMATAVARVFASRQWPDVREPRSYLFRAVLHEALDSQRSTSRRVARELRSISTRPLTTEMVEIRVDVLDSVRRLSVRQRAVVFMTFWLDFPVGRIATELGISARSVQRDLESACQEMEEYLR